MGLLDAVSKSCLMSRTISLGTGVTAQILLSEFGPLMYLEVLKVKQKTLVTTYDHGW